MPPGIPITAYSACNGLGQTTAEVLESLFAGRHGLTPAQPWLGVSTWVGMVPGELPALEPSVREYESRQARLTQLVTLPMLPAIERSKQRWGSGRIGLILGTSTAGIGESEDAWVHHRDHGSLPSDYAIERQHALYATLEVVRRLTGVRGPSYVVSTACSSSGKVFASARRLISAGIIDAAVVGGVDSLCRMTVRGFASLEVLSPDPCRPFSSDRRGISIGEGAALLLLERRGQGVEGIGVDLLGVGESSDAHHMTAPHPEGRGACAAMQRALAVAGVDPAEVDQINVHGTGTSMNDETESKAIRQLFASRDQLSLVATKGYTGHLLGAAGATEAVFVAATIERGELPASVGTAPLDPTLGVEVELERRPRATRRVLSNSLAFGGSNVSVLLGASE
jgi:3-oxoacyl-[acyl-carrier-protein] synthase-1